MDKFFTMKIAVIADIHGNTVALKKCLQFIKEQELSKIFFLGDAVGYLPFAKEVIDMLREEKISCIKGNHEAMLLGLLPMPEKNEAVYKLNETKKTLSDEELSIIKSWNNTHEIFEGGKKILMVHGSPKDNLNGYIYPDTDLKQFDNVDADVIIFSHTHYPFIKKLNNKLFINTGSVGLPRDCGNLASLAVYNCDSANAEIYRIPFSTDMFFERETAEKIHPAALECLLRKKETFTGTLINETK